MRTALNTRKTIAQTIRHDTCNPPLHPPCQSGALFQLCVIYSTGKSDANLAATDTKLDNLLITNRPSLLTPSHVARTLCRVTPMQTRDADHFLICRGEMLAARIICNEQRERTLPWLKSHHFVDSYCCMSNYWRSVKPITPFARRSRHVSARWLTLWGDGLSSGLSAGSCAAYVIFLLFFQRR